MYAKNHGVEIYDILLGEFGDSASDTIVYSYIFRLGELTIMNSNGILLLAGPEADQPRKRTTTASSSRPLSPLLPSSRPSSGMSSRERVSTEEALFASRDQERPRTVQLRDEAMSDAPVKQDTELERLVKNLTANNKPAVSFPARMRSIRYADLDLVNRHAVRVHQSSSGGRRQRGQDHYDDPRSDGWQVFLPNPGISTR